MFKLRPLTPNVQGLYAEAKVQLEKMDKGKLPKLIDLEAWKKSKEAAAVVVVAKPPPLPSKPTLVSPTVETRGHMGVVVDFVLDVLGEDISNYNKDPLEVSEDDLLEIQYVIDAFKNITKNLPDLADVYDSMEMLDKKVRLGYDGCKKSVLPHSFATPSIDPDDGPILVKGLDYIKARLVLVVGAKIINVDNGLYPEDAKQTVAGILSAKEFSTLETYHKLLIREYGYNDEMGTSPIGILSGSARILCNQLKEDIIEVISNTTGYVTLDEIQTIAQSMKRLSDKFKGNAEATEEAQLKLGKDGWDKQNGELIQRFYIACDDGTGVIVGAYDPKPTATVTQGGDRQSGYFVTGDKLNDGTVRAHSVVVARALFRHLCYVYAIYRMHRKMKYKWNGLEQNYAGQMEANKFTTIANAVTTYKRAFINFPTTLPEILSFEGELRRVSNAKRAVDKNPNLKASIIISDHLRALCLIPGADPKVLAASLDANPALRAKYDAVVEKINNATMKSTSESEMIALKKQLDAEWPLDMVGPGIKQI